MEADDESPETQQWPRELAPAPWTPDAKRNLEGLLQHDSLVALSRQRDGHHPQLYDIDAPSGARAAYERKEKALKCLADWAAVPGSGFSRANFEREVLHDKDHAYLTYRFDPAALQTDASLGEPTLL